MELTKIEVEVIEKAISDATDVQLQELSALQLAYVGGGTAEVTLI